MESCLGTNRPDPEAAAAVSQGETDYACLWKEFFEAVSIKERENLKCQQSHLPLRFRGNMTEFSCEGNREPSVS